MEVNIEKINWIRIEKGLTITKLAEKAGMSKATISRILKGGVTPRPDTVGKIAIAFNISAKDLYIKK